MHRRAGLWAAASQGCLRQGWRACAAGARGGAQGRTLCAASRAGPAAGLLTAAGVAQVMACSIAREAGAGRPAEISCMDVIEGKAPAAQEITQGASRARPARRRPSAGARAPGPNSACQDRHKLRRLAPCSAPAHPLLILPSASRLRGEARRGVARRACPGKAAPAGSARADGRRARARRRRRPGGIHLRRVLGVERRVLGEPLGRLPAHARRPRALVLHPELAHGGAGHVVHRGHDPDAHRAPRPRALRGHPGRRRRAHASSDNSPILPTCLDSAHFTGVPPVPRCAGAGRDASA